MYAHLEGAEQVTLEGVFHSVDKPDEWYGSEGVVDRWLAAVVKELGPSRGLKAGGVGAASFSDRISATPLAKLFGRR